MIAVSGVPLQYLDQIWPAVEPLFVKGGARTGEGFPVTAWRRRLTKRHATLWIAYEHGNGAPQVIGATLTTKLIDGAAVIWAVVGTRFTEWGPPMLALIEGWARASDCKRIETRAIRKGWARWADHYGFVPQASDGAALWYAKEI